MHRSLSAAVLVAPFLLLVHSVLAGPPTAALEQARGLLDHSDARAAVAVLEEALPKATSDRAEVLALLRQAYDAAARLADVAGQPHDAEMFRDNLAILNRKSVRPPSPTPSSSTPTPTPSSTSTAPLTPPAEPPPAQRPSEPIVPAGFEPAPTRTATAVPPRSADPEVQAVSMPATEIPMPALRQPIAPRSDMSPPAPGLAVADVAFLARRYDEAGRIFAALDAEHRLPPERREHWAYCRWVDVVRRINAPPTTSEEWASIDAEIARIRELSPNHWYGEYLRNLAAERRPGRPAPRSKAAVIRGSSPDEPPIAEATGHWLVRETANFRVHSCNADLAERVAQVAEATRDAQTRRWMGSNTPGPWSPRCEIFLFPTARQFSQATGQPEESPGFSTMGLSAGRVVARRVNLRADHPNVVPAILPHEVTHVILADLFPNQQIPRWADEGMAVLSEPRSEQSLRASDLQAPLASGHLFKVQDLMVMDYPDGKYWSLYYAQSVSLTRYLVEQGTPAQFIEFVQSAQRNGAEAELRRIYKIGGFTDLQKRWLAYAHGHTSEMTASTLDRAEGPATSTR